jgi:hypothetical protein
MKHLYFFLLLITSHQLFAQWSQVGSNIGNAGSNAGVGLFFNPSTNEPYVAYPDNATGTIKVLRFNGSSWAQVGTNLGNVASDAGISLVFKSSTNEPHIAYPDNISGSFVVQKFNGSSWSQVGANLGSAAPDASVSLAFKPSTNQLHIAYQNVTTGYFTVEKFGTSSWSQVGDDLGFVPSGTGTYDPDVSLMFNSSNNQPYVAYSELSTFSFKVERYDGLFWNLVGGTHLGVAGSDAGVSVAFNPTNNEPYVAYTEEFSAVSDVIKIQKFNGSNWSQAGSGFGNVGSEAGVSLVFNPSTNEAYVAYRDNSLSSIVIKKLSGNSWSQVGSNLGNVGADSGVSLAFKPDTNEPYIAYPDNTSGAIIVQKFSTGLSTNDLDSFAFNMRVFPNPTNSELNIELENPSNTITVKTMDFTGKVISTQLFKNTNVIKTKIEHSSGLYFVEVSTNNGNSKTIKVIKK